LTIVQKHGVVPHVVELVLGARIVVLEASALMQIADGGTMNERQQDGNFEKDLQGCRV